MVNMYLMNPDKPIGKIVLIYIRLYLISPALSENIQLFLLQMKCSEDVSWSCRYPLICLA
jgi:hypothetical protein